MSMASKKHSKLVWVAAVVGAIAVLPAAAQTPAPSEAPKPAAEVEKLAFFVGNWTCKGQMGTSALGPPHATVAKVRVSREHAGFWYVGHYSETKTAANPHPLGFEFIQGYDPATKTYTMDSFQSDGIRSNETSTGWEGDKIVFTGTLKGTPVRSTLTQKGRAGLDHLGEVQVNGNWVTTDHEICTLGKK